VSLALNVAKEQFAEDVATVSAIAWRRSRSIASREARRCCSRRRQRRGGDFVLAALV